MCGTDLSTVITCVGLGFRGGAACTLVLVYVSIRLREVKFSSVKRDSAQQTRHNSLLASIINIATTTALVPISIYCQTKILTSHKVDTI